MSSSAPTVAATSWLDLEQLRHALIDVSFPAQRWELIAWAAHNGAGYNVRNALQKLADGWYGDGPDVATGLAAAGVSVVRRDVLRLAAARRPVRSNRFAELAS